jgi:hypothetical protein
MQPIQSWESRCDEAQFAIEPIFDFLKAERSHATDEQEFSQLLSYVDDIDLNKKLAE